MLKVSKLFSLVFLLLGFKTFAQFSVTNPQGISFYRTSYMFVKAGNTLHVDGNFTSQKDSAVATAIRSNGTISLTGNLVSTGAVICTRASSLTSTCKFIFTPKTDTVSVIGDSLLLYHVFLNKPNSFIKIPTGSKIHILDTVEFQGGNIVLNGGIVYLNEKKGTPSYINNPFLLHESHNSRIFGDNGYVEINSTVTLSTTAVGGLINPGNMGLFVHKENVENDSLFRIRRVHAKQVYAGNGSITRYYDVRTGVNYPIDSLVKISYVDSAEYINLGIDRHALKIFASPGADMNYVELPGTNTLTTHIAEATTKTFTNVAINPSSFRVTVADRNCANPPVSALASGTIHLCAGQSIVLDAGNNTVIPSTSLVWTWNNMATTQTISVSSTTITQQVTVVLRDVRGCLTYDTVYIAPTAPTPTVNIYPGSACFGDSLKLKALTGISSGSITNYFWQFGDATTFSTALNDTVRKRYAAAGTYSVALTVTSDYGCMASITRTVVSIPLPQADFTSYFNCATGQMEFTSTSTSAAISGAITQNYWNFDMLAGSALTSFGASVIPSYSYAPGTYSVQLVVKTGSGGCMDTVIKAITIYPKNSSSFSVTNVCLGDTLSFINNSLCNTGTCQYLWDFGDGTQSIAFQPKKVFTSASVYNVKLKVLHPLACADSSSNPVIVHPKPGVSFSITSPVCLGEVSYFTNATSIATGSIVSYNWNFGNTVSSTNTNASITYTASGNYPVSLTATSNLGCTATLTQNQIIAAKPVAQYNVPDVCFGQQSQFNDNSIGGGLTYIWDFGNTVSSSSSNPGYNYPATGTYTTSLIITDGMGCKDTAFLNTTVHSIPTPSLGGSITTCGTSYTLDAGPGASYVWQPLNATSQTVTITSNGTHTVTVTDGNGCIGQDNVSVGLNMPVKPHLGNDTIACGPYLLNAGYPGSSFLWNTGASTQTLLATGASTYIVTVTDLNGCIGKDTAVVFINALPTLSLGPDIIQCQSPQPAVLTPTTNATSYLWNNGSVQPALQVTNTGNYVLTVTDLNSCKQYDTIHVTILPSPVVDLGLDANVCGSKLLDAQNSGFSYAWSDGSSSQTVIATLSGAYWVMVTNPGNGCTARDTVNLGISLPVSVFLGNDTSVCSNALFILSAGNPGLTYHWSTGAATQTLATGSSGAYGVTVTNGACSAFDAITVSVLNAPVVNLGNSISYLCGNGSVHLNAGTAGTATWGSSNGFISNQPMVAVSQSGIYWVTVSNGACSSSDTVQVIQSSQVLNAYFIASTVDTVGTPVKFVDVSEPLPTSWHWDFGDGFYSTVQSPEHAFLTPQTYSVTLLVSNGFCESQITKALQVIKKGMVTPKDNPASLQLLNFSVYPNPAHQSFKTLMELNDAANIDFSIYDVTGKLVYKLLKNQVAVFDEEIHTNVLGNGLYMVEIIAQSRKGFVKKSSKLVVVK